MILLFIILPAVLGSTIPTKLYFTTQHDVSIINIRQYLLNLIGEGNDWPLYLNYTQNITSNTGLDITVGFAECNGTQEIEHIMINRMDICDVLKNSLEMPNSLQSKFMISEMLGLFGIRCPIKIGLKNMHPYRFPTIVELEDIGTGIKEFIVNIQDRNTSQSLITLAARLDMKYWDEKNLSTDSSSSMTPSLIVLALLILTKFILQ